MNNKQIRNLVYQLLQEYPAPRGSDKVLITMVCTRIGVDVGRPFIDVLLDPATPNFESIRRARQLVQAKHPELRASDAVIRKRIEKQGEYLKYVTED